MSATPLNVRFKLKRNSAAFWAAENPVLLAGEPAIETDTLLQKVGDGVTAWNSLAYLPFDGMGIENVPYSANVVVELTRRKVYALPINGACGIDIAGSPVFDGKTFILELTREAPGAVTWGTSVIFGDDITSVPVATVNGKVDCVGFLYRHGVGSRVMSYIRF